MCLQLFNEMFAVILARRVQTLATTVLRTQDLQQSLKLYKSGVRHFYCRILRSHNSPADWTRELFKRSKDAENVVLGENLQIFGFCFFVDDVIKGKGLRNLGQLQRALGANATRHLWLKFLLDTKVSYESLETFIAFLALMMQILWSKKRNWGKYQILLF